MVSNMTKRAGQTITTVEEQNRLLEERKQKNLDKVKAQEAGGVWAELNAKLKRELAPDLSRRTGPPPTQPIVKTAEKRPGDFGGTGFGAYGPIKDRTTLLGMP